ncbi:uncharacterized protein LOC120437089 [Oreochromis aureus]|uniref:uncharacterized protein LOC120437089 n=1 Tax=Oreochromis aureus TaxID=47969 RepID=UPI001953DF39|nr:uncharacterized protein LOC120437089 [Oreochromis aureus]
MSPTSVPLTYSLLLLFISRVSGKLIQTAAGDDVRFALTEECKTGKGTLHHQLMDGTDQLVASLDGVWKPGPGYINRVVYSSDSLILKTADFNDHGYYAFTCNYKQRGELEELHVFLPNKVVAPQDERAILPCRSVTAGQAVKSVRWRRDGELVLELNPPSKQITYGDGYDESRVSIPSDWYQRGDLSLTVKRAQLRDDGVYYCDVEKTEKHRSAVHLHVSTPSPPPGSTSQPTTTPTPSECSDWSWRTFSLMAVIFVIVDLLVWLCWFLRNRKFNVCTRSFGGGSSEREEEINLKSVTISNSDGHLCNGTEEGGEGTEEGRESDCDQQNMIKSNGNPDFTHN